MALALANFNLSAQDGGDGATSELIPLNVIGSKIEAPLSTGLKSSLPANKVPQSNPTTVDFEKKPLMIFLRSLVENMITPIVEIIIPRRA